MPNNIPAIRSSTTLWPVAAFTQSPLWQRALIVALPLIVMVGAIYWALQRRMSGGISTSTVATDIIKVRIVSRLQECQKGNEPTLQEAFDRVSWLVGQADGLKKYETATSQPPKDETILYLINMYAEYKDIKFSDPDSEEQWLQKMSVIYVICRLMLQDPGQQPITKCYGMTFVRLFLARFHAIRAGRYLQITGTLVTFVQDLKDKALEAHVKKFNEEGSLQHTMLLLYEDMCKRLGQLTGWDPKELGFNVDARAEDYTFPFPDTLEKTIH
jgi:hypothetical protein